MKIVEFKDYDNQTTPLSAYNLNRLQQNLITTKYQMTFSSAVSGGSTITLPCYYQVGQDTLDVYLNSELLKKASTKDSEGHYYEVGNSDTKSNQIKITSDWSIASGDVLNLIVRGTTDSYDQNLSPDKATQLADEISANKEEITALQTENSRLKGITNALPKISGEDTSLTLTNTANAPLSDIILKGNTSQQQYSGKNLVKLYETNNDITNSGLSYDLDDDGKLSIKGTTNRAWDYSISKPIYFEVGKTYTFSVIFLNIANNTTPPVLYLSLSANNGGHKEISKFSTSITFTIKELQKTPIKCSMPKNLNVDFSLKLQIEEGSKATDYEPYVGGTASPNPEYPQEIHCVKGNNVVTINNGNVLPNNLSDDTINGITFTINGDKSINLSGTATSRVEPKLYNGAGYTIPAGIYKNTTSYRIIGFTKSNYMIFESNVLTNLTKDVTFKQLYFRIESGATVNETIYPQIILSSTTDTSYVPHEETEYVINLGSIELCKIGDYQDYIYKSNDKWYKHKAIDKIENISSLINSTYYAVNNVVTPSLARTYYSLPNCVGSKDYLNCYCNKLKGNSFDLLLQNANNISTSIINGVKRLDISISQDLLDDVSLAGLFKKIKEISPIIYYACTPTEEEIIDTTLISQLNALYNAYTYNDTTNITQTNANLPFYINAEAFKKIS